MLHDLSLHCPPTLPEYDLCIIGSGPAGATLAAELVGRGLRICVLESGRLKPSAYGDRLRATESDGIKIKSWSRERVLGGASTTWAGLSGPFDPIDFAPRPWTRLSGWPIPRDEFLPWYGEAARYRFPKLANYGPDGFAKLRAKGERQPQWEALDEKVFLAADPPQNFGKEQRAVFERPDLDTYLDASVVELAGARGRIEKVVLRTSRGDERALSARVYVVACGGLENARLLLLSRTLCANGIGNERDQVGRCLMNHPKNYHGILQLEPPLTSLPYYFGCLWQGFAGYGGLRFSEPEQARRGLLNSYVRFEPLFPWSDSEGVESLVALVKKTQVLLKAFKGSKKDELIELRDYSETGDDSELQNARRDAFGYAKLVGNVLGDLPRVSRYAQFRLQGRKAPLIRQARLRNFLEMEPDPDNRVRLSTRVDAHQRPLPLVRHRCTELDRRSAIELHAQLERELPRAGLGRLETTLASAEPWPIDQDASHHMGTTRMGCDPLTSVVDPTLRVHEVENLWIAGGSVFPTSGCANPTFTLVALSIRLARYLEREVFRRTSDEAARSMHGAPLEVASPAARPAALKPAPTSSRAQRNVLVIGAAKRALETALPAFAAAEPSFRVRGVWAKHEKTVVSAGRSYDVQPFARFDAAALDGIDLVYVAVSKAVAPRILQQLLEHGGARCELLIDTPVLLPKHFRHVPLLERFKACWVPEDCAYLPWLPLVERASATWLGALRKLEFDRSAYAYHAHATLRTLAGAPLSSVRRTRRGDGHVRRLRFENGVEAELVEPRDYATGRFAIRGERGVLADYELAGAERLSVVAENGWCVGFALRGDTETLDERESALVGPCAAAASVTALHEAWKRVGFLRLLRAIDAGAGGYPVYQALEDTLSDYALEKLGRFRATRATSPRFPTARKLYAFGSRIAGR
jgi:choline dehydrogenase-like flavoprotein